LRTKGARGAIKLLNGTTRCDFSGLDTLRANPRRHGTTIFPVWPGQIRKIASTRGRDPQKILHIKATGGDLTKGAPIIGGSAGASEPRRHPLLWRRFGADDHPAGPEHRRGSAYHGALVHAVRPVDSCKGDRCR